MKNKLLILLSLIFFVNCIPKSATIDNMMHVGKKLNIVIETDGKQYKINQKINFNMYVVNSSSKDIREGKFSTIGAISYYYIEIFVKDLDSSIIYPINLGMYEQGESIYETNSVWDQWYVLSDGDDSFKPGTIIYKARSKTKILQGDIRKELEFHFEYLLNERERSKNRIDNSSEFLELNKNIDFLNKFLKKGGSFEIYVTGLNRISNKIQIKITK